MNSIEENIKNTYDIIALDFNKTRIMIWKCVQNFINEIVDKESFILDAGCGNGKNMLFLKNKGFVNIKGCDFSYSFIELCKSKYLNVEFGNLLNLPYETNLFDNIISIAVIHHLSTEEHRIKAISELLRVVKIGGQILITVSSFEFPFYKKMESLQQDLMIPWKTPKGDILGTRYYYLFKEGELEKLCHLACPDLTNIYSFFEHENWCVILTK
jgi:ubiquinone/menaquinone biosynthesis C-methylase UbiE